MYVVNSIRKLRPAIRLAGAASVVGVQMRVDDTPDIAGCDADRTEFFVDASHNIVRRLAQLPDPGIDEREAAGCLQQESMNVPGPARLTMKSPGERPALGFPVHPFARQFVSKGKAGIAVTQRNHRHVSNERRSMRHDASLTLAFMQVVPTRVPSDLYSRTHGRSARLSAASGGTVAPA